MYSRHSRGLLQYLALVLIANANDIEVNPGPSVDRKYQCGTCDDTVNWSHKGIIYKTCDQWYHAQCQGVHTTTYMMDLTTPTLAGIASSAKPKIIVTRSTTYTT